MEKTPELDTEMRTNILQTLEELRNLDEEIMDGLETLVLKGVNRGLSLADKLRKYERIDQDETQTQVNLAMLLKDVVAERKHRLDAADAKIVISVPSQTPLIGSPELFAILLGNLLDNSIDALLEQVQNPRRILVSAFVMGQTGLRIVWEDSGIGIKPESISKIFQPFYTEKPRTGSGLGLSMVKNIVEKYMGAIDVESVVGQYTRLTLDFPDV